MTKSYGKPETIDQREIETYIRFMHFLENLKILQIGLGHLLLLNDLVGQERLHILEQLYLRLFVFAFLDAA